MPQATAIVPDGSVRPGYNATGTELPKGRFVTPSGALADSVVLTAADTDPVRGVTMGAIATLQRGDIQTFGEAIVEAGEAIALHADVSMEAATGKAKTAQSGDMVAGICNLASTATGQYITVDLSGPSSGRIKA
jgi:hypothetical protein